jgi:hypothetical protein
MTEADWLAAVNPDAMLAFLQGKLSQRKLRLFACACVRRIDLLVKNEQCRQAVESAEYHADGVLTEEELAAIHAAAENAKPLFLDAGWAAAWTAAEDASQAAAQAWQLAAGVVASLGAENARSVARAAVASGATEQQKAEAWGRFDAAQTEILTTEGHELAALLREIAGNPFLPSPSFEHWPLNVVELAEALYLGEDCGFALHDALLEAGQTELATHFSDENPWHPRGCWALDFILGRS